MNKSDVNDVLSPVSIREMATAFQRSRVILTAYELELFTVLGNESKSSVEVSTALGTDERATDRLMNALCAMGLLEKKGSKFSNSPTASRFLMKGKLEYMSSLMHVVHMWDSWSTLTNAIQSGTSVVSRHIDYRGEKWLSAFIAAMHERAHKHGNEIVSMLDLSDVSCVLDVGGGSGAYSMALVRAQEGIKATVFDLPNIIPITKRYVEKEGFSDKIYTVAGDYNIDSLGTGFDLVFLSAVVHSNSPQDNKNLIGKCAEALNPQGQVVVLDFIMDENRVSPFFGALFALNMLVATESGDTYTESEVRFWMNDAGLSNIVRKETDFNTTIIIGRKMY